MPETFTLVRGWGRPAPLLLMTLGALVGLLWGVFGMFGYLQFNPEANFFAINLLRRFIVLAGAGGALLEDLITRGFVMGELERMQTPAWVRMIAVGLLFALYHSVWGLSIVSCVFSLVYRLILGGLFLLRKRCLTPVILAHSLALLIGEPFPTLSLMKTIRMGAG
ncbi:MAG: CPBP family glutamic-type intramembrane protease [Roseiflexaceae bacterium]|nr:CPBP family glutamic-type intramembrane protease [Roseiflexaceae bacterium]MDW8233777.1 CPBP family glutamic-type intramembrane protease [Roseiflexaceae bacterium]